MKDNVLFVAAKDGVTVREILRAPAGPQLSDEQGSLLWSPDGKYIYFVEYRDYYTDYEVWRAPIQAPTRLRGTEDAGHPATDHQPGWEPYRVQLGTLEL